MASFKAFLTAVIIRDTFSVVSFSDIAPTIIGAFFGISLNAVKSLYLDKSDAKSCPSIDGMAKYVFKLSILSPFLISLDANTALDKFFKLSISSFGKSHLSFSFPPHIIYASFAFSSQTATCSGVAEYLLILPS